MNTLTGRPANSTHLGTFLNGIIMNNSNIKDALQQLEDAIEDIPEIELKEIQTGIYRYTKTGSPFVDINTRASTNLVVPFTGVTSTTVQDALEELQANIGVVDGKHHPEVTKVIGFNPALRVANVTQEIWLDLTFAGSYDNIASGLISDNIQGAIDELKILLDATGTSTTFVSNGDGTYDWDNGLLPITVDTRASSNPVTPTGNLSSTNVQDALEELQSDINAVNTFTHVPVVLGVGNSPALTLNAITQSLTLDFDAANSFEADASTLVSTTLFNAIEELDSKVESITPELEVQLGGVTVGSRSVLNYIEGQGVSLNVTENIPNNRIDVEIDVTVSPGGDTINNYTSTGTPQQLISTVTGAFENYTVASSNDVSTVHQNGQLLDPSEYLLVGTLLTVTPDIGLEIGDELTVVQYNFATVTGGIKTNITNQTSGYIISSTDQTINCTSGTFTVELPSAIGIAGRMYFIKNSGTGVITVEANGAQTIDGALTQTLNQWDGIQIQSEGSNWIILK
jgi:hypothetical protein